MRHHARSCAKHECTTYKLIKVQKVRRPFVGLHKYALVVWVSGGSTSPCCYALCLMHLGLNEGRLEEWVFLYTTSGICIKSIKSCVFLLVMLFQVNSREAQEDVDLGEVFVQDLEMVTWWFEIRKKLRHFYWFIPIVFPPTCFWSWGTVCGLMMPLFYGLWFRFISTASCVALNMRRARPLRQQFLNMSGWLVLCRYCQVNSWCVLWQRLVFFLLMMMIFLWFFVS